MRPWRVTLFTFKTKPYRLSTAVRQLANCGSMQCRAAILPTARRRGAVVLLTEARSGSEFFSDCLAATGAFVVRGEVLNPWAPYGLPPGLAPKPLVMRHIGAAMRHRHKRALLKLGLTHLAWHGLSAGEAVRSFPEAAYIVLFRGDLLRQFVSGKALMETGRHRIADAAQRRPYRCAVDPDDFRACSEGARLRFNEAVRAVSAAGVKPLVIRYEDLVTAPQALFDEAVFPAIGLPPGPVEARTVRQNTQAIRASVANFDHIEERIRLHRYLNFDGHAFALCGNPQPAQRAEPARLP